MAKGGSMSKLIVLQKKRKILRRRLKNVQQDIEKVIGLVKKKRRQVNK